MKAGLLKELTIIDLAEIRRRKCDLPWWSRSEDGFTVQRLLATLDTAYIVGGKCCAEIRELKAVIERQGKAIEDLELRLHQTNDAHALSCSEHLKALTEIERQGKALRAVESLESFGATVELTTLLGTREMVTGAEVEVVSAAQLRAALAERGEQS